MTPNPYDETLYENFAFPASHPNRLAVIATLFGREVPALASARVLEIGCASGGNLLPMAAALPAASFVGLDYSAVQIAQARRAQAELGLSNIEFLCADIADLADMAEVAEVAAASLGTFDFILAHGVYSWLPPSAQTALLGRCRDCLNPLGIAYVSYNTLPGWHSHALVRELMQFHVETVPDRLQQVQQARGVLDFMTRHVQPEQQPFQPYLSKAARSLADKSDSYLRHDYLAEYNEPLYFKDFIARRAAGLELSGRCGLSVHGRRRRDAGRLSAADGRDQGHRAAGAIPRLSAQPQFSHDAAGQKGHASTPQSAGLVRQVILDCQRLAVLPPDSCRAPRICQPPSG